MNTLNYARAFAGIDHQFIVTILVPLRDKKRYETLVAQFDLLHQPNVMFSPIFLESQNESFRNFLNPRTLTHDSWKIVRTIRRHRPDAVIAIYVIHAYPLILLKKLLGFALFVTVSGGDLELHKGLIWRIARRAVYSTSQIIFAVGHKLKAEIERESGHQVLVMPPGTDPDRYKPIRDMNLRRKHGFRQDDFVVLTLSQLIDRKCIDDVIRAVGHLKHKHANVKMIVAGDGPDKTKLMGLCKNLSLSDSVFFTGSISDTTKRDLFNIADVYVIASYQEGMPFSLLEAMSCECICLCSNVGDIPNLIDDSVNGFLIKPREPQLLAKKVEEVMDLSSQELARIRKRARRTILDQYDSRNLAKDMIEIIESEMC